MPIAADWKELHIAEPRKRAKPIQRIPLGDIGAVYRGAMHFPKKHKADVECALSLGATKPLCLEAKTKRQAKFWYDALERLMDVYRNEKFWLKD